MTNVALIVVFLAGGDVLLALRWGQPIPDMAACQAIVEAERPRAEAAARVMAGGAGRQVVAVLSCLHEGASA